VESARVRAEPRKSEGQCLPCAAHGGEMQARSGRARQSSRSMRAAMRNARRAGSKSRARASTEA